MNSRLRHILFSAPNLEKLQRIRSHAGAFVRNVNEFAPTVGLVTIIFGGVVYAASTDALVRKLENEAASSRKEIAKTHTDISEIRTVIAGLGDRLSERLESKLEPFRDVLFDHHDRLARFEERATKSSIPRPTEPKDGDHTG
jgi:hypothetical protein